jgi:hypothetical protein
LAKSKKTCLTSILKFLIFAILIISASVSFIPYLSLEIMQIFNPSSANYYANSLPIPYDPPVITAHLPKSL